MGLLVLAGMCVYEGALQRLAQTVAVLSLGFLHAGVFH